MIILTGKKVEYNLDYTNRCPECSSTHLSKDHSRAELICRNCGLVIDEDLIDYGPEWRAFDSDQHEKRARVGAPIKYTIHDKGLSTSISWKNKDAYGKSIPHRNRAQLYRMRKWQARTRISNVMEKNLASALSILDRMSSSMSLPRTVRERAAMIYRKATLKKLVRGRSMECIAAATIYASCRQCNVPRTLEEISRMTNISRRVIGRNYRHISHGLRLKMLPTTPRDYIPRFCNILKLSNDVQMKTYEILKAVADQELTSGRGPTGIAAASIYIAAILCGEKKTQREVADVAGVTEVTIRNRYQEISKKLDIDILL
jgi:transcription initiation factor TFIIB